MDYLDYSKYKAFLQQRFADNYPERLVGPKRDYDSGYFDIARFYTGDKVDPRNIEIEYTDEPFQIPDERIASFASEIADNLRSDGKIYDGPLVMKLASYAPSSSSNVMKLQPVDYSQMAGSCFALDFEHPLFADCGGTLRSYYKQFCPSHSVVDNPLAITLGVCGLLVVGSEPTKYLRVRRSRHLATLAESYSTSVAGSVDFVHSYRNLWEINERQLEQELSEELSLSHDEYEIVPLAYAREILRGERPQLFSLVITSVSMNDLLDRLKERSVTEREFDRVEFVEIEAEDDLLSIEAVMNLQLLREYILPEQSH